MSTQNRNYGGVIWTNHALQRARERGIKQSDVWAVWNRPSSSKFDSKKGNWIYRRVFNGEEIEVVARKNQRGEWIILSLWSSPKHHVSAKRKDTFFKKLASFLKLR